MTRLTLRETLVYLVLTAALIAYLITTDPTFAFSYYIATFFLSFLMWRLLESLLLATGIDRGDKAK